MKISNFTCRCLHVRRSLFLSIFIITLSIILFSQTLGAEDILNEDFLWAQNLTETWNVIDDDRTITSFSDIHGKAVYQIIVFNSEHTAAELNRNTAHSLGAQSEAIPFMFNGHEAVLSEARWTAGTRDVHGYIISIDDRPQAIGARKYPHDYVLMSFSISSEFDMYHDFLLSNLDGFAPLAEEYHLPGVLNQFIRTTGNEASSLNTAVEAAYAVIQREARILNQFSHAPDNIKNSAWRRYYQMLYKDSFHDMDDTARDIDTRFRNEGLQKNEYPAEILSWLQTFSYRRTGTLSDLEPSLLCIRNEAGDCDSLGLTYMAILKRLGIESILMISPHHSHSLVGVDSAGAGARFPFMGRQWLAAELTADVPIGSIAEDQADPGSWLGFSMDMNP
ncbi:MAG: hypothetical protein ACR2PY_00570 [Salinispira sp.]